VRPVDSNRPSLASHGQVQIPRSEMASLDSRDSLPQTASSHSNDNANRNSTDPEEHHSAEHSHRLADFLSPLHIHGWQKVVDSLNKQQKEQIQKAEKFREAEIADLYAEQRNLKQALARLEAEKEHLTLARRQRDAAGKDPLEYDLARKNGEIWDLLQRNSNLQKHARFFEQIPTQKRSLEPNKIDDYMNDIRSELESIFHGHGVAGPLLTSAIERDSDLFDLIESFLAPEGEGVVNKLCINDCISGFHPYLIIKTLTISALRRWVFETDYPSLVREGPCWSILQAYREIAMDCGELS
jgi:hypothetical protein